jgi:hypothetical protein
MTKTIRQLFDNNIGEFPLGENIQPDEQSPGQKVQAWHSNPIYAGNRGFQRLRFKHFPRNPKGVGRPKSHRNEFYTLHISNRINSEELLIGNCAMLRRRVSKAVIYIASVTASVPEILLAGLLVQFQNGLRQLAADRSDGASHRRAEMKSGLSNYPAFWKRRVLPANPSEGNRGSGPRDNRKCNLQSGGVIVLH